MKKNKKVLAINFNFASIRTVEGSNTATQDKFGSTLKGLTMKHYAVAYAGNQYFVVDGNNDIVERCHNRATAAYYANKLNANMARALCLRTWSTKRADADIRGWVG